MKGYDLKFESVKIIEGKVVIDTNLVVKYEVTGPDVDLNFPVTGVESNDVARYILFTSILMLLAIIIKKRF